MGWKLEKCDIVDAGERARTFQFEVVITGIEKNAQCLVRGDGYIHADGNVFFNREEELRSLIFAAGSNPQHFLNCLGDQVATEMPHLEPRAS